MKKIVLTLIAIISFGIGFSQEKDPVLLEIGNEKIHLSEFEAIYNKNNDNPSYSEKDLRDYLDLFIKFKLKVHEAKELGLDTLPQLKKELAGYRKQLAQPYLNDKEVTDNLIKEAYERMKYEVRASHILIKVQPNALPKDTLAAYKKIMAARKRIIKGEPFEKVAQEVSEDEYVKQTGGDLGYFSALYMVYPFENAAYNTKVGEVSMPVRTQFGYHLVKVTDKRPSRGKIKVAHIMVRTKKDATEEELKRAEEKIKELYEKAKNGEDFAELAKKYSDDKGSAFRGGELPVFGSGRMVESFEEAAFALKNNGDISEPVKTPYGWHIIKRIEKYDLAPYDEMYNEIKSKVERDSRSNKSRAIFINKLKKEYNFKENKAALKPFFKLISADELFSGKWNPDEAKSLNKFMFGLYASDGQKAEYTQQDFARYIAKHQHPHKQNKGSVQKELTNLYNKFVEEKVLAFEDSRLEKKYPKFRLLMQEYQDGILLFDLTDKKVWSKAVKDTAGLRQFYMEHRENYKWPQRVDATLYKCKDEKTAKTLAKLLKKAVKKNRSEKEVLDKINENSTLNVQEEKGIFAKQDNPVIDLAEWKDNNIQIVESDNQYYVVKINKVIPPTYKTIDEARGIITSDYQNYLEEEWVKELKQKYPVKLHEDVLQSIIKQ